METFHQSGLIALRNRSELTVDPPVHLANLSGWVEKALQDVTHQHTRSETYPHRLDRFHDSADDVRTGLEDVGPHQVEQVGQGLFVTETRYADRQVLDDGGSGLTVDVVSVGQGVFQKTDHGVNVVFGHFADVFKNE